VAADIGVSQTTLSRIERGRLGSVRFDTIDRLADGLGLKVDLAVTPAIPDQDHHIQARAHRLIAEAAADGGWSGWTFAHDRDPTSWETRLQRRDEIAVLRVWDVVGDVERSTAEFERSMERERAANPGIQVSGAVVIVQAGINTRRLGERGRMVTKAFPVRGSRWLVALRSDVRMPSEPGLIWTGARVDRLRPFLPYVDRRQRTRRR
jgi:transcriptional regulator with XRE-family HTH domain